MNSLLGRAAPGCAQKNLAWIAPELVDGEEAEALSRGLQRRLGFQFFSEIAQLLNHCRVAMRWHKSSCKRVAFALSSSPYCIIGRPPSPLWLTMINHA